MITLSGDAANTSTTDSNGYYQFGISDNFLSAGNYTVAPLGNSTPESQNVTINTGTMEGYGEIPLPITGVDFVVTPGLVEGSWNSDDGPYPELGSWYAFRQGSSPENIGTRVQSKGVSPWGSWSVEGIRSEWKLIDEGFLLNGNYYQTVQTTSTDVFTFSFLDGRTYIATLNTESTFKYELRLETEWVYVGVIGDISNVGSGPIYDSTLNPTGYTATINNTANESWFSSNGNGGGFSNHQLKISKGS
jgi:hypothetical protein